MPPEQRKIGFVYQDYMLFPNRTLFENIAYGLKLKRVDKTIVSTKVESLTRMLGIDHLLHRYPETLSGGELQRGALARALVIEPRFLFLDEPLNALDPQVQEQVREELRQIHNKMGLTTIHVTHSREEAMVLADRIGVMNEGRIVQIGTPHDVFRRPVSPFLAEFVGVRNILKGTAFAKNGRTLIEIDGTGLVFQAVTKKRGKVHLALRPEDIIVSKRKLISSARNVLAGEITALIDKGIYCEVRVDCGEEFITYVTHHAISELEISLGAEIYLVFKASSIHVF